MVPLALSRPCLPVLNLLRRKKEGNVLFNDELNTFYLKLYSVRHMVKDHEDSERGNPLPPHGLLFPISSKYLLRRTYLHSASHVSRATEACDSVSIDVSEENITCLILRAILV